MTPSLKELVYTEIQDFFHGPVSVFTPDDHASKVLGVLDKSGRYEAVVKSPNAVGIITVRDLLAADQPSQTKVDKLWNATGAVSQSTPVFEVIQRLVNASIRALPVVKDYEVLGIISQIDIMNMLSKVQELAGMPARDLVNSPVWSLESGDSIANTRRLMLDKGVSHVPVTNDGRLVGMVTADMLVHTFIASEGRVTTGDRGGGSYPRWPGVISGFMDRNPVALGVDSSVLDAVQTMTERDDSACMMIDENRRILGILTPRELMEPILGLKVEEELPIYIIGLSDEDFFEKAVAEDKLRRVITKGLKFRPDITEISVRIKAGQTQGNRKRYDVTAKALSADDQINAKASGWDLMSVFDEISDTISKAIRRTKPEKTPRTRRRGRR